MGYRAFCFQFTSLTLAQIKNWEIVPLEWYLIDEDFSAINPTSRLCTTLWRTAGTFSLCITICLSLRESFNFRWLPLRKFSLLPRIHTEKSTASVQCRAAAKSHSTTPPEYLPVLGVTHTLETEQVKVKTWRREKKTTFFGKTFECHFRGRTTPSAIWALTNRKSHTSQFMQA